MSKPKMLFPAVLTALAAALALGAGALASSPPTVSNESSGAVTNNTAVLSGSVNPSGQETSYAFEYGTDTHYSTQTAVQSAGTGTQPVPVTAQIGGLRPGTTYHYRILATNASGTTAGSDATFKTSGIAPPPGPAAVATTAAATGVSTEAATVNGTISTTGVPAGENVSYYFQVGASLPYALQTPTQTIKAAAGPVTVKALVNGLAGAQTYHYRLVTVTESGVTSLGADQTVFTLPSARLTPTRVVASASPRSQRTIPDRVTVRGRMVPPPGMSKFVACRGYFDITFRVGQVAVQSLRAGIHSDCTFSLPVVFHSRKRLNGGRVTVHVLFAGNRFLHRLEAPTQTIQVG